MIDLIGTGGFFGSFSAFLASASVFRRAVAASWLFLVKDNAILGVSQSKFSGLLGPIRSPSSRGHPSSGNEISKLLAKGISHQRTFARLQMGRIHVLSSLVKSFDSSRKVDRSSFSPRHWQYLAVATADTDLTNRDRL